MGAPIAVNNPTNNPSWDVNLNPDVQLLDNGNFVIAWDRTGAGTNGNGIIARVFDQSGNPVGDQFLAGTYTSGNDITDVSSATTPEIVDAGGGEFWVLSTSQAPNGNYGLFAQKVDLAGNVLGVRVALAYSTTEQVYYGSRECGPC